MRRVTILAAASIAACGGKPAVHEHVEAEPAWAAEYATATARACECTDDPCIRAARTSAEAVLAAHGGIEAAPPSVHAHKSELEACWLATSRDLGRDLGAAADAICACDTTECVGEWSGGMDRLAVKYGVADRDQLRDGADATASAAWDRAARCVAAMTITGADYLAALEHENAELCACSLPDCAKTAIDKTNAALAKYLIVAPDPALGDAVVRAEAQRCKCAKKFPPSQDFDVETTFAGMPVSITGSLDLHYSCDDSAAP
jgi:hypothetical protein